MLTSAWGWQSVSVSVLWLVRLRMTMNSAIYRLMLLLIVNFNQIKVRTGVVFALPLSVGSHRWDLSSLCSTFIRFSLEGGHLCEPCRYVFDAPSIRGVVVHLVKNQKRRKRFIFGAIERAWPDQSGAWRSKHKKTTGRCPLVDARRHVLLLSF